MVKPKISLEEHKKWLVSTKILAKIKANIKPKQYSYGLFSNFFVSSHNFPNVTLGPSISNQPFSYPELFGKSYDDILLTILSNVHGKKYVSIDNKARHDFVYSAMAIKPFYAEMWLKKNPTPRIYLSPSSLPVPPSAGLIKFIEAENIKIPRKVYNIFDEKIKASVGVKELYARGYDVYYIQRLFSAGILGEKKKIVPTRWSITAVDDIISDYNKEKIIHYNTIEHYEVYHSYFLSNMFVIILMPGTLSFENFEAWAPKTTPVARDKPFITLEREGIKRRKVYAHSQAGAYYAVKNVVFEHLAKRKKQARIIVIREVYEGYNIPLGVWQVRENVKNALSKPPFRTNDLEEALMYADKLLRNNIFTYLKKTSRIKQHNLNYYLKKHPQL